MNLNFCRYHCRKAFHPRYIFHSRDGKWFLCMNEGFANGHNEGDCTYVEIEDASNLVKQPPEGWYKLANDELHFDRGDASGMMWGIRLKGEDSACPYFAEHLMYDIQHEKRIEEWHCREKTRRELIEGRIKNAKADCKELP